MANQTERQSNPASTPAVRRMQSLPAAALPIAEKIAENLAAADWIACCQCGQEYRPRCLKDGICDLCSAEADRIHNRQLEVFGARTRLIEMAAAKFEVGENVSAYIAARDFDPATDNLYLWGAAGTGKTMLAAKIIRQAIQKRQSCAFRIAEEWLRSLYGASGQDQQNAIDRLVNAKILVIDEIGFEPTTEFSGRALYDVINSRMLANRNGLVVTSNLSLERLAARLNDDRIPSRIGGMCRSIELKGRDWRQPS